MNIIRELTRGMTAEDFEERPDDASIRFALTSTPTSSDRWATRTAELIEEIEHCSVDWIGYDTDRRWTIDASATGTAAEVLDALALLTDAGHPITIEAGRIRRIS